MNNIFGIFPTPIYKEKITRSLTEEEVQFLDNVEKRTSVGNLTSVNQYLLESKALVSLKLTIEEKIKYYFKTIYDPENNVDIFISQSWLSFTRPGEHHHKHRHPNSFISGVYYLKANFDKDKIYFYDKSYRELMIKSKTFNIYNSDSWYFPVESGDLLLFPSNLEHMVETVEESQDREIRISLAFNTFLKGKLGNYGTSTELIL